MAGDKILSLSASYFACEEHQRPAGFGETLYHCGVHHKNPRHDWRRFPATPRLSQLGQRRRRASDSAGDTTGAPKAHGEIATSVPVWRPAEAGLPRHAPIRPSHLGSVPGFPALTLLSSCTCSCPKRCLRLCPFPILLFFHPYSSHTCIPIISTELIDLNQFIFFRKSWLNRLIFFSKSADWWLSQFIFVK